MSWAELASLAAAGWEIGSHTHTHPRLVELSDPDLAEELGRSRRECETRLGLKCNSLAYPYGAEDERVVRAAGEAGYVAGGALPDSQHEPSPLRWPRVGVYRHDDGLRFRAKTSPLVQRLRVGGRFRVPQTLWRIREGSIRRFESVRKSARTG
jgi:peptidoglycan/xylan/chitin deacetylase (PgdA/CDA1 family)